MKVSATQFPIVLLAATLVVLPSAGQAQTTSHPETESGELLYEGSPRGQLGGKQVVTPGAPPLSEQEFATAPSRSPVAQSGTDLPVNSKPVCEPTR